MIKIYLNLAAATIAIWLAGCGQGSSGSDATQVDTDRLPFDAPVFDILVGDFNDDGLADLALTTHTGSFTQLFYQHRPRHFVPGPTVKDVGFHPGDLLQLRSDGLGEPHYLMNAEGENALRVYRSSDTSGLERLAELGAPAPRVATEFSWPGRGRGLAFGPFSRNTIFVITEFQPLEGSRGPAYELPLPSSLSRIHQIAAADLDDDGNDEILFVDATNSVLHSVSAPEGDELPAVQTLWRFDEGGRHRVVLPADINQDGRAELLVPEEAAPRQRERSPAVTVFSVSVDGRVSPASLAFSLSEDEHGADDEIPDRGFTAIDFAVDNNGDGLLLLTSEDAATFSLIPKGWDGQPLDTRRLAFGARSGVRRALLRDLDGDGWLDAVMGLSTARGSNLIIYGPLWDVAGRLLETGQTLEDLP